MNVTKHFLRRVRKRRGLTKRGAYVWAQKAFAEGLGAEDFSGQLRDYLLDIENNPRHDANMVVVFDNYTLLLRQDAVGPPRAMTLLQLPAEFRRAAAKPRSKA